jgi:hypothetical protein
MEPYTERYYYPLFLVEFPNSNDSKMNEPVLLTVRVTCSVVQYFEPSSRRAANSHSACTQENYLRLFN